MDASFALPLLRSPPFPNVDPATAAVSARRPALIEAKPDLPRAAALVESIAKEEVAGDFWDPAASSPPLEALRRDPELAYQELISRVSYRDPFTAAETTAENVVALLAHWRREISRNPGWGGKLVIAAGVAGWKRRELAQLLWAGSGSRIRFAWGGRVPLDGDAIAAWPARIDPDLPRRAADAGMPFWRMEDGFIRSVGLGAACHPPFSIVLDRTGAHYDPSSPSDLETLLATAEFPADMLTRADELIDLIVRSGVSKYEIGGDAPSFPPRSRRRILVTGQVEDDLSVLLGGRDIHSNIELLQRARAVEPDAEIWFKPHPDVDGGHRKGRIPDDSALAYADRVVRDVSMAALYDVIDGIHVWTSLAGFEALLRQVEVTTHGTPFYAGWGLTNDLASGLPRRNRALSISELAAGVLLVYPKYLDPVTGLPCTPEILIQRLSEQKRPQETWLTRARDLQGKIRRRISQS